MKTATPIAGTTQKVLEYTLRIRGIWGRKRKSDSQSFRLAQDQLEPLAEAELQALVDAMLAKVKVKTGECAVMAQEMSLEATEYPNDVVMVSRCFAIFTNKLLQKFNIVAGNVEGAEKFNQTLAVA